MADKGVRRGALVEMDHDQDRAALRPGDLVQGGDRLAHRLGLVAVHLAVDELDQRVDHDQRRLLLGHAAAQLVGVLRNPERHRVLGAPHLEEGDARKVGACSHQSRLQRVPRLVLGGDDDRVARAVEVTLQLAPRNPAISSE